ncbi:hypothetical protein EJB05_56297, partial [Eragrostis curvula]
MAHGIRHTCSTRAVDRSASQRSPSNGGGTSDDASQSTRDDAPSQELEKKRGRKFGSQTKLAVPILGAKVALEPSGDFLIFFSSNLDDYLAGVRRVSRSGAEAEGEEHEAEGEEHEDMEEEGQEQEQTLNGQVLYEVSGGTPHGRLAIAHGAIRAADVRAAAKQNHVRPSNPVSLQNMARENALLRREVLQLHQEKHESAMREERNQVTTDLLLDLYRNLGKEIPAAALQRLSSSQANVTGSSHIGSGSTNHENNNPSGHERENPGIENNSSPRGNHVSQ